MIKSKAASRVKTIDNGLALRFKRAAEYVDGKGGLRGRLDIEGKCPDRRYRFIHKDRLNLYDGFVGDWKPLSKEDNKGERLNRLTLASSEDGFVRVGDLVLAWQPEETAQKRDDVVLYHNHVAANTINFTSGAGVEFDEESSHLQNESVKTVQTGQNEERIQRAESLISNSEAKVSEMIKEKLVLQKEMEAVTERLAHDSTVPKVVVPESFVPARTRKKPGRKAKDKKEATPIGVV